MFEHLLDDIAVANLGFNDFDAELFHGLEESEVAHDGGYDRLLCEQAALFHISGADGQDGVSVDNLGIFVDHNDAVGIAIEGDAYIGFMFDDGFLDEFRIEGAALIVDVEAIWVGAIDEHFGIEFSEDKRGDAPGGSIGAVEGDADIFERFFPWKGGFGKFDIAAIGIGYLGVFADVIIRREAV